MPKLWDVSGVTRNAGGIQFLYQVVIECPGVGAKDYTYFRGIPTQITSYSSADPFGDAVAQIQLPQVSIFDEIGTGDLDVIQDFADVNINLIYWPKATMTYWDVIDLPVDQLSAYRIPVWEGFIASFEWHQDETGSNLTLQCKGACFQVDEYLAKPQFPQRPLPYENMIKDCFSHNLYPALRTAPLKIEWPAGWDILAPNYANNPSYLTPVGVTPGEKITGYFSRATGSWDKQLTSFVQGLLSVMLDSKGQNWTIRMDPGRQPVLYVRQMYGIIEPDYVVWAAQPGVQLDVTRDLTQYANVFYGQGTDTTGTEWDRQEVSNNGQETAYDPLAYDQEVYPIVGNAKFNPAKMTVEAYSKFSSGFDERQALDAAKLILSRDMDPGLAGTLTLTSDPQNAFLGSIKAGKTIKVLGLLGSGDRGVLFNIAEADHDPMNRSVSLKIDTKFRDLLTLDEVLARTRDPLTPVSLLKINSRDLLIQDIIAPWNYKKGSGFIPNNTIFFKDIPTGENFPYVNHSKLYPPKKYPHMYVTVNANAKSSQERWKVCQIRLGQAGSVRLTEVAAYDEKGNVLKIPFHFSLYYATIRASDMPHLNGVYSPFLPNAFQSTSPTGELLPESGGTTLPQDSLIVGWGNDKQPAGYSPGAKTAGDPKTGLLIDETPWTYDMAKNKQFANEVATGTRITASAVTVWAIFYAEYSDHVHFRGRFYNQSVGTT